MQCPAPCETSACARTRVVTAGITLPLEVFHTGSERGWGVRCRQGITPGSYLCSYAGAALADTEAVRLPSFQSSSRLITHSRVPVHS